MSSEHYFSKDPQSESKSRLITVNLAGVETTIITTSGTFSASRIDPGTSILINEIDLAPRHGNILDLGCGWGPISIALARHAPEATVWALDVNQRSLDTLKQNANRLGIPNIRSVTEEEIPSDLQFSAIWSNPPIRIGKQALHDLLLAWLPRLAEGGECYLVVQKNLGSDSLQKWLAENLPERFKVSRLLTEKSYRILKVLRAK